MDLLLAPWQGIPEDDRRAIVAALQVFADAECQAIKNDGLASILKQPAVDVYAARRDGQDLVVHYLYHFRIGFLAQSGSDWDEHHLHTGAAVCRGGVVASRTIVKEMISIRELACPDYDEAEPVQKRLKAARKAFWDEWMSLPFPFPGSAPE